jgi:hypothetical protein
VSPVIHYYQHAEGGAVHGFTHPLHPEIAKQVRGGELVKVADPDGTDPDVEIARLRALVAQMAQASGIDPSSLEAAGLADTADSRAESDPDEESAEGPDDEDDDEEEQHLCLECGEPVERNGKTGPWPQRHKECK